MKKIITLLIFTVTFACAYCEYGTRRDWYFVGGHIEAIYNFGQGRMFKIGCGTSFDSNRCPYSLRYDFWTGEFCR